MGRDAAGARERKRHGRHYTPADLAEFLAERVVTRVAVSASGLRVLDPACGAGELLFAMRNALGARCPGVRVELVGYDLDPEGLAAARRRAEGAGVDAQWRRADFLAECAGLPAESFDAVIANPPYVRTQQLGGAAAEALRGQFGLRGRFDLTHPFVAALPRLLVPGGVLGLLCANRFLTTKAGANLRAVLLAELSPVELYDLGDTKLFEAAVLPAVTIAVRGGSRGPCRYVSVYQDEARAGGGELAADIADVTVEVPEPPGGPTGPPRPGKAAPLFGSGRSDPARQVSGRGGTAAELWAPGSAAGRAAGVSGRVETDVVTRVSGSEARGAAGVSGPGAGGASTQLSGPAADGDLFAALCGEADATVRRQGRRFAVTVGELETAAGAEAAAVGWRMSRVGHDDWLRSVSDRMWHTFGDLGRIRVGIKTNADRVFIAAQWGDPAEEPELLRDLITHHDLRPWRIDRARATRVLYPYEPNRTRRVPVDLSRYPRTAAYLEQHRELLAARGYLTGAGRQWFEHWVPQRPHLWRVPKVVFPDISDRPRFALDRSGAVVNGDCYWISLADLGADARAEDLACLMMGVANSALGLRFYDAVCGNRLYSGRRRWITQYVSRLPLPDPATPAAAAIVRRVRVLTEDPAADPPGETDLNDLVNRAFAL
ncbi:methyltransferase domain-containing protein [Nocardia sp. NPDC024068]|uniref:Eco57I restriction-modification methylase domain-containing protein n=1 Tax=Nocardia sp. NPDC024068 TaxID=3157197 RepID=UPI0033C47EDF